MNTITFLTSLAVAATPLMVSERMQAPPELGVPMAYYPLNDIVEGETADITRAGNDAIVEGAPDVVDSCGRGQSFSFSGEGEHLVVPDADELDVGLGDFTLSMYVQTNSSQTYNMLLDKRDPDTGVGYEVLLYRGEPMIQIANEQGHTNYLEGSLPPINDGECHHLAISIDRDQEGGAFIYVDGEVYRQFTVWAYDESELSTDGELYIGRQVPNGGSPYYFTGELNEIRIYDFAQSQDEVIQSMRPWR